MTAPNLSRITISHGRRRVDLAVPADVPLADLMPQLLAHAGDDLADEGQAHGGWRLCRLDGTALAPAEDLGSQDVRDGAILRLAPAGGDWPEPEYDDVGEAVAAGVRRRGWVWTARATTETGLAAGGVLLAAGLGGLARAGSGRGALGAAVLLLAAGIIVARRHRESTAGAVLAGFALPFALLGGALAANPSGADEAYGWLGAAAALAGASLVGAAGAAGGGPVLRVFVAGAGAGVLGGIGALVAIWTDSRSAAAVMLGVLVPGVAITPVLSIRLGRLILPVLSPPADPPGELDADGHESLREDPARVRAQLDGAVVRTDEILTGLLTAIGVLAITAGVVLARTGGLAVWLLLGVVAAAGALRARAFVTVRHRLPLLVAGLGLSLVLLLAVPQKLDLDPWVLWVPGGAAGLALALLSVRWAWRAPSPYAGRAADLIDTVCLISVIPLVCAVLGLFDAARDLIQ